MRINQWVSRFRPNGSFRANGRRSNTCALSFAPHMQALADMIAQRLPPPVDLP